MPAAERRSGSGQRGWPMKIVTGGGWRTNTATQRAKSEGTAEPSDQSVDVRRRGKLCQHRLGPHEQFQPSKMKSVIQNVQALSLTSPNLPTAAARVKRSGEKSVKTFFPARLPSRKAPAAEPHRGLDCLGRVRFNPLYHKGIRHTLGRRKGFDGGQKKRGEVPSSSQLTSPR